MNNAPALADPAFDRYVIAVGASDSNGTVTLADDTVPAFSPWPKRGATRSVDLIAPGAHIQGLRVPNSYIDKHYPGRPARQPVHPWQRNVPVRRDRLGRGRADPREAPRRDAGRGQEAVDEHRVRDQREVTGDRRRRAATRDDADGAVPNSIQIWPSSIGTGKLELSRGTDHLTLDGVELTGEQDIFGQPFDSEEMAALEASGSSWSGVKWNGSSWSGSSWSGNSWSGNSWSGSSWSGNSWSGSSWSGNSWSGNSWSGNSWSGNSWSTASWD